MGQGEKGLGMGNVLTIHAEEVVKLRSLIIRGIQLV